MKKAYLYGLIISFFAFCQAYSQTYTGITEGIVTESKLGPGASPNAEALSDINVDLFHGSNNATIPLYQLTSGTLKLPVKLTYLSRQSNVRSGWVGKYWSLRVGGAITRIQRGERDEAFCTAWPNCGGSNCDVNEDEFKFNFCGYSGSFFYSLDKKKWVILSETDILHLSPVFSAYNKLTGFLIGLPDGMRYTFGFQETVAGMSAEESIEDKTTWYLTEIKAVNGDLINFYYQKGITINDKTNNNFNPTKINADYIEEQKVKYQYKRTIPVEEERDILIHPSYLRLITTNLVDMEFVRSADDKLDMIRLVDKSEHCFKKYKFSYDGQFLKSVQEIGVNSNESETSKPSYSFDYGGNVLERIVYPTGGFVDFEYDYHRYYEYICREKWNPHQPNLPIIECGEELSYLPYETDLRLKHTRLYNSEDEEPLVTTYFYSTKPQSTSVAVVDAGQISRKKHTKKETNFSAFYGYVKWSKETNYDMVPYYMGVPAPNAIGYSEVSVKKPNGDREYYVFQNYDFSLDKEGQRYYYPQVGQLLSVSNSQMHIGYDYDDPDNKTERISHSYIEYYTFDYNGHFYSKKGEGKIQVERKKYSSKPKRIITYERGALTAIHSITTLTYNYVTGNVVRSETVNQKDNSILTVDYNYPYNNEMDVYYFNAKVTNVPYEIIRKKNGKVIDAEVIIFEPYQEYPRPWKKYKLSTDVPVDDYQPLPNWMSENVDPRCKLLETYEYDYYGNIYKYQQTGQEPVFYEWDLCRRLISKRIGDMETRYTHGIHGITSVAEPNGTERHYEYDALGRVIIIRDEQGAILQKYDYEHNLAN